MEAVAVSKQELRFAENLTLPTVQVVVMRGNMRCDQCQQRTVRMISRMGGLVDYTVDVRNKEVVFRGLVDLKKSGNKKNNRKLKQLLALSRLILMCCSS